MADSGFDVRFLFSVFIFIGVFAFLGGLFYTSLPQETLNISNISTPPKVTTDTNQSIFGYVGYLSQSVGSLASTNTGVMLMLALPILATLSFIIIRLIKPF